MNITEGTRIYWKSGNMYATATGKIVEIGGTTLIEVIFDNGKVKGLPQSQIKLCENSALDFTSMFHIGNFSNSQHLR